MLEGIRAVDYPFDALRLSTYTILLIAILTCHCWALGRFNTKAVHARRILLQAVLFVQTWHVAIWRA